MRDASNHAAVGGSAIAGPIDEHRPANDQTARNKAPIAAVFAVVTAIAHHEKAIRRNDLWFVWYTKFSLFKRRLRNL